MATQQSALSPDTWPFDLSLLPETAYLVGGSVRDALLGRRAAYLDLDFVLPPDATVPGSQPGAMVEDRPSGAIAVARFIAKHYEAGFVVLDATHQIARVVFARATVDFAQQVGPSLESDLHRRDFTINAIAYHPHRQSLFDPINGHQDLQLRQLRMISPENLMEDPLRLLRAYRQAAQLGFSIDAATQAAIRRLVNLIQRVAAERIRGELDCLLSLVQGTHLLQQAWQDGVIAPWLPNVTAADWAAVDVIDQTYADLRETWPDFANLLTGWLRESTVPGLHRSWLKATKLTQLLSPDLEQAEQTLVELKYSRAEQQATLAILRGWELLQEAMVVDVVAPQGLDRPSGAIATGLPRRLQYSLFKQAGPSFPGIALLALSKGAEPALVRRLLHRYQDPQDPIAHPQALITGRDLMQTLHLKPGPQIGALLEAVQVAQAEGLISTPDQALDWAAEQAS